MRELIKLLRSAALLLVVMLTTVAIGFAGHPAVADTEVKSVAKSNATPIRKISRNMPAADASAQTMQLALSQHLSQLPSPEVKSAAVTVIDQRSGRVLYEKNATEVVPIASITKLMTAIVVLDARQRMDQLLTISKQDVDTIKGSRSRLRVGTRLTRRDMLQLALMSSENRAAFALSRYYPGGRKAFVAAMNRKAIKLGMYETEFHDPTGLMPENVSSAYDIAKLAAAAYRYPLIRKFTTTEKAQVAVKGRLRTFTNTNRLVRSDDWTIGLSKTGYIDESGRCLVMQASLNNQPTIIVLLDSLGRLTRIGDANRIKHWIESLSKLSV